MSLAYLTLDLRFMDDQSDQAAVKKACDQAETEHPFTHAFVRVALSMHSSMTPLAPFSASEAADRGNSGLASVDTSVE